MHRSRKLRAAMAAVTVLGSITVLAGSAQAAVPGLIRVSNSVTDSMGYQSVTATCPAGKALTGGGYQLTSGSGEVIVDDFVPTVGPTGSLFVGAYEADPNHAPTWTLTAFAICADPMPGLTLAMETSPSNSLDKSVVATCPTGKTPVGTGFEINGGFGDVTVNFLQATGTSVQVTAYEEDPLATDWSVTAFAVCADPPLGLQHIFAGFPIPTSDDFQNAVGFCTPGRVLLGMGFEVSAHSGELVIDDFVPTVGTAASAGSFNVGAFEADPDFTPKWTVTAQGICAFA